MSSKTNILYILSKYQCNMSPTTDILLPNYGLSFLLIDNNYSKVLVYEDIFFFINID